MTNRKHTKRALILSALSLLLCVSMLVGSTMAWFTDNATTGVNKIESGTLDVVLNMWDGESWINAEGKTLGFVDEDNNPITEPILWEPGCRYKLQPFQIVNNGTLALKYDVVISAVDGDTKLAEVIEYGVPLGDINDPQFYPMGNLNNFNSLFDAVENANLNVLNPGESTDTMSDEVTLQMMTSAGNEYQGLTITGISITVRATQATVETDSFDKQYDAAAEYDDITTVKTAEEFNTAIDAAKAGDVISVPAGTFAMNGANSKNPVEGITIIGNGTVMDSVNGFKDCTFKGVTVNDIYTLNGNTFENCTIAAPVDDVACATQLNGDAKFVGCTFTANGAGTSLWLDAVAANTKAEFVDCTFVDNIRLGGNETNAYTFKNCKFLGGKMNWSKALVITYAPCTFDSCSFTIEGDAQYGIRTAQGITADDLTFINTTKPALSIG